MVNGNIVEKDASYAEAYATVELERGKVYTATNIYVQKDVESPILTRNQVVKLNGLVKEEYEAEDNAYGFKAVYGSREVSSSVNVVLTFTNSTYPS
jgi:hypothetical protein